MYPETLFQIANPIALIGWATLAAAPLIPRVSQLVAGLIIPLVMAVFYTALILANFAGSQGNFSSLAGVQALFSNPYNLLAGWVHYLAFDMLIGAWITRTALKEAIPHLFVLPCLALTFLFGPAGFLFFTALRAIAHFRRQSIGA
jgi:hypothetical protein